MDAEQKLELLADDARFESCDSFTPRKRKGKQTGPGITTTQGADGKPMALFRLLQSNSCEWDCPYCPLRRSNDIERATLGLHAAGHAHSIECWKDGRLVGGLYGVRLGRAFFGESMFARETDASKVALVALVARLRARDFAVIDCQQNTAHLASLGAREIPRAAFSQLLQESIQYPLAGERWSAAD